MTDTQAVRKAGTVLLVCFATVWCGAQSVVELAARGRETAVKGKPAKVYTNQDLKNAKGRVSQSRLSRADAAETSIPSAGPVVPVGSSTADPDDNRAASERGAAPATPRDAQAGRLTSDAPPSSQPQPPSA